MHYIEYQNISAILRSDYLIDYTLLLLSVLFTTEELRASPKTSDLL